MSTQTNNYKLMKPDGSDKYNIGVFNSNFELIDTQMKANSEAIGTKQKTVTGAATTVLDTNLTSNKVVISNTAGKLAVSTVTDEELAKLAGVTDNIQDQLADKLPLDGTAVKATADANGKNIAETYAVKTEVNASVKSINDQLTTIGEELDDKVPITRTVNGKPLSADITIGASDVGALPSDGTAEKATADADGNVIADTYAKKSEIPSGVTVDSALSSTSEHPVQNKAVTEALSGKQPTITGAASTIVSTNLTADRVAISNSSGKMAVSPITTTKLGYLAGVTSDIQEQLEGKLPSTGTAPKATADGNGNNIVNTYATKDELTSGLATKQPTGEYATKSELSSGLATKQPTGDYATNTALTEGLSTKQPVGDYATNTALNTKQDKIIVSTEEPTADDLEEGQLWAVIE